TLNNVHVLAAAVVAPAGVAFGVLVGEDGALRGEDRRAGVVLRGDHLQPLLLPPQLGRDRLPGCRIDLLNRVHRSLPFSFAPLTTTPRPASSRRKSSPLR